VASACRSADAAETAVLAIGLPDLPFHLRLDNLSAVFALLLGFAACRHLDFRRRLLQEGRGRGARH
jgi:hydrogenase-4 component B